MVDMLHNYDTQSLIVALMSYVVLVSSTLVKFKPIEIGIMHVSLRCELQASVKSW